MLAEPLKSLGKKGKTLKIARNSSKRKKARKSKKARKRRLGLGGNLTWSASTDSSNLLLRQVASETLSSSKCASHEHPLVHS